MTTSFIIHYLGWERREIFVAPCPKYAFPSSSRRVPQLHYLQSHSIAEVQDSLSSRADELDQLPSFPFVPRSCVAKEEVGLTTPGLLVASADAAVVS
jgi:hypothetical protein